MVDVVVHEISFLNSPTMSSSFRKVMVFPSGLYVRGAATKAHFFGRMPSFFNDMIVLLNTFDPGPSLHTSQNNACSYLPLVTASRSPFETKLKYGESITSKSLSQLITF